MATNSNWPAVKVLADFTTGPPNAPGANAVDINTGSVAVTDISVKRGRQYELDKVQAGTAKLTISDRDEQLNPSNTASPWNSAGRALKPYRPIQIQATWNGATYNVYTGYIERFPMQWEDNGKRGMRPIECVDALSILSQIVITQSYEMEIAQDNPTIYMPLDDGAPPGMVDPLTISNGVYTVDGGSIQWGGDTLPDGGRAVVLTQQVQDFAKVPDQFAVIDSRRPNGLTIMSLDTSGSVIEFWAKLTQGSGQLVFQNVVDGDYNNPETAQNFYVGLVPYGAGPHHIYWQDPHGNYSGAQSIGPYFDPVNRPNAWNGFADDQWHYFAIRFYPFVDASGNTTGYTFGAVIDDVELHWTSAMGPIQKIGINSIHLHATSEYGDETSKIAFARVAYYDDDIGTRTTAHYLRGIGHYGETATDRITRLLGAYWGGPATVSAESTTVLDADHGYNGRSVLDVLQEISGTTLGLVYADKSGRIVYENRFTRYVTTNASGGLVQAASIGTFGEADNLAEFPYTDISFDFDPTYVYSQSALSRPNGTTPVVTVNSQAVADYGPRVLSQTLNVTTDFDLEQAGIYYSTRYANPLIRIEKLTIDPSANPSLWPLALGLEISQRVTVQRRTTNGNAMSAVYCVESIEHEIKSDPLSWTVQVELSPVFVPAVWILGDSVSGKLGQTTVPVY